VGDRGALYPAKRGTELLGGEMGEEDSDMIVQFELFPSRTLLLCLVEGVTNAAELRQEVLKQKFEASFIDAAMVPAPPCRPAPATFPSTQYSTARQSAAIGSCCTLVYAHTPTCLTTHPRTRLVHPLTHTHATTSRWPISSTCKQQLTRPSTRHPRML